MSSKILNTVGAKSKQEMSNIRNMSDWGPMSSIP